MFRDSSFFLCCEEFLKKSVLKNMGIGSNYSDLTRPGPPNGSLVRESYHSVTRTPTLPGGHCASQHVEPNQKTVRESYPFRLRIYHKLPRME